MKKITQALKHNTELDLIFHRQTIYSVKIEHQHIKSDITDKILHPLEKDSDSIKQEPRTG